MKESRQSSMMMMAPDGRGSGGINRGKKPFTGDASHTSYPGIKPSGGCGGGPGLSLKESATINAHLSGHPSEELELTIRNMSPQELAAIFQSAVAGEKSPNDSFVYYLQVGNITIVVTPALLAKIFAGQVNEL